MPKEISLKILFITRKYPPSVGGMETHAYELHEALVQNNEVSLLKWGGSNSLLPILYPWLAVKSLWRAVTWKPQVIYLQDGIMAPIGWFIKLFVRWPSLITVHGLDITFKNPVFQAIVPRFIAKQTAIAAVSEGTKQEVLKRLPSANVAVVPNGVKDVFKLDEPKQELLELIARETNMSIEQLQNNKLLLTTGRLVRRKGVAWFVSFVMPGLVAANPNLLYLVCGAGKQQQAIEEAISRLNLGNNVKLLGRVSSDVIRALYNIADIFVMPNIPTPGNVEGFGLVALEAASCGTTVIASDLEGIRDAVRNGKNGYLVEPKNIQAWHYMLTKELAAPTLQPTDIRSYTLANYSWQKTAIGYQQLFESLVR